MTEDPTAPLSERTPDQIADFVDDHLLTALGAAEHIQPDRQTAEDYVRDRLVALSDSFPDRVRLEAETHRRRMDRLRRAIGLPSDG